MFKGVNKKNRNKKTDDVSVVMLFIEEIEKNNYDMVVYGHYTLQFVTTKSIN